MKTIKLTSLLLIVLIFNQVSYSQSETKPFVLKDLTSAQADLKGYILDSSLVFRYPGNSDSTKTIADKYYWYPNGLIREEQNITYNQSGGIYYGIKNEYTWTGFGKEDSFSQYEWKNNLMDWKYQLGLHYQYLDELLVVEYEFDNNMDNSGRSNFYYNTYGHLIRFEHYLYLGVNQWSGNMLEVYVVDSEGLRTEFHDYENFNDPIPHIKTYYTYENGLMTESLQTLYNQDLMEYVPNRKGVFQYTPGGNQSLELYLDYKSSTQTYDSSWIRVETYNEDEQLLQMYYCHYGSNGWEYNWRWRFEYDQSGFLKTRYSDSFYESSQTWELTHQTDYFYYPFGLVHYEELLILQGSTMELDQRRYYYYSNSSSGHPELNVSLLIDIFPNPASGEVRIEVSGNRKDEVPVMVHDAFGRIVYHGKTTNGSLEINTAALTKGLYFVNIVDDGSLSVCKKLIIQ